MTKKEFFEARAKADWLKTHQPTKCEGGPVPDTLIPTIRNRKRKVHQNALSRHALRLEGLDERPKPSNK